MNYQFNWHHSRGVEGDEYEELTPLDYLAMRNRDALRDWRRRYFASASGKHSTKSIDEPIQFQAINCRSTRNPSGQKNSS